MIDTSSTRWATEVRSRVDEIHIAIDQVGGELFPGCLETLGIGGRYVTVGRNGGKQSTIDLDLVARQRLELIGVTFRTRTKSEALACSTRFANDLLGAFDDGSLRPVLDAPFPLEDLPAAHNYMLTDAQIGKIVLVP